MRPLTIVLLTPRRRFIANRWGLGYQIPLGLVLLGGPLLDAGHKVRLIDNDMLGWDDERLCREVAELEVDCILIGHTGSTAAHPVAMRTAAALRRRFPATRIIYGGVYPSYADRDVLEANPAIDIVVRGEGEAIVLELAAALSSGETDLAQIAGITWRDPADGRVRSNRARPPIADLDAFRPGWELVAWDRYQLFGFGRAAGMQFSRGCPLACTYCGQWNFWRRWRHRSPENFVDELETLVRDYGVKIIWLADENFGADREVARTVLQLIVDRDLGVSLNLNMTAADVARDADLMPLYKRAGVDNIVMGIEALDDDVVASVRKNNPLATSLEAVRVLRQNNIVSLVNVIYGLESESLSTLWRTARRLFELDCDVLNAVYITPHFWTPAGRRVKADEIIQPDQALWTYRNQIIHAPKLRPWQLFLGVKLTEVLFHLRPRALARTIGGRDARHRKVLRAYMTVGARVVVAECIEFVGRSRRVKAGSLTERPSFPRKTSRQHEARAESEAPDEIRVASEEHR